MPETVEINGRRLSARRFELGNAVHQIRMSRKLTQVELSAKLGWTRTTLLAIEKAQQATTVDQLYELADALKVDVTAFFPLNLNAWLQNMKPCDLGKSVKRKVAQRRAKR